ncbi:MAG: aminomethyl-transferring glycine dehydrogenase [Bacteroidales bacterium]|nr:aminomethyl-transferring glycine dehydrogenase [Bacteroidales bacterium]MCB9013151.1 aminomethyl-transferring glycine dehydrogenase [Bacteroidales bacterium]
MSEDKFVNRHNGLSENDIASMLKKTGVGSLDELIAQTVPSSILMDKPLRLPEGMSEFEYLKYIREIGKKNKLFRSFIGMGYYNTITLPVIQRNILENPSWYTSYTPYQAEISQGRLEALLNFQTMVMELTGMEIANASLLDESTAAAEAMIMMYNSRSREAVKDAKCRFFADKNIFPQTLAVMHTRAIPLGIELVIGDYSSFSAEGGFFGAMIQYPDSGGEIRDYSGFVKKAHDKEVMVGVAADLMSLVLLCPPGEWDADVVVGSSQRFGVPMGYGGPHAGFFACKDKFKRNMPGRIIGISVDRHGNPALRMALQTREQHIKREKATSNICTAQALLANMAGMYAIYHGPEGLKRIALKIHSSAAILAEKITALGYSLQTDSFFDTLKVKMPAGISASDIRVLALEKEINLYYYPEECVGISLDETVNIEDINDLVDIFARCIKHKYEPVSHISESIHFDSKFIRKSEFLRAEVFHKYRSETEMMRYIKMLERKDISLTHSMISLGSCTMKLNAASQLMAFLWPEFSQIHPFAPLDQVEGYQQLFNELDNDLRVITGFDAVSFQPNSGAAGEYAGLMVIRAYHESRGESHRNIVLIPASAHGTNPASAVMAGMEVVVVDCDSMGNVNFENLKQLAEKHRDNLAGFMITYPSTHGVFEESVKHMIDLIHLNGGQVYMDGANMNAQVGLTNPALIGADVCHLNLHKTFAIPHGGGGPGVGPIAVASHLVEFLPTHPLVETGGIKGIQAIAGAPYGSASILTISHAYIKMLGGKGLTEATRLAILNANYLAACLKENFSILYTNKNNRVAHEMILDCRPFKQATGISEADIAKRLMDYGFHAPTLSFPVHGTLMVEPTESESRAELDRFIDAMNSILSEIKEVGDGRADKLDNVLKNAPHTALELTSDDWKHPYGRQKAAYPLDYLKANKFWPSVARLDDAYGDRNLVCSCLPTEAYKA